MTLALAQKTTTANHRVDLKPLGMDHLVKQSQIVKKVTQNVHTLATTHSWLFVHL
jgi:hypothetical protein